MSHTDKASKSLAGGLRQEQQEPIESFRTDIGKANAYRGKIVDFLSTYPFGKHVAS